MTPISRGFGGRRRDDVDPSRIPPGQYYERGFPVLSAGPTMRAGAICATVICMRTTGDNRLVDEATHAHVDWLERCLAVQDAYDRWARAARSRAAAAFLEYTIALDREERSSLKYAQLVGCVVR
jgi:hypothetical protein